MLNIWTSEVSPTSLTSSPFSRDPSPRSQIQRVLVFGCTTYHSPQYTSLPLYYKLCSHHLQHCQILHLPREETQTYTPVVVLIFNYQSIAPSICFEFFSPISFAGQLLYTPMASYFMKTCLYLRTFSGCRAYAKGREKVLRS